MRSSVFKITFYALEAVALAILDSRRCAGQPISFDADMFIEVGPLDRISVAQQLPAFAPLRTHSADEDTSQRHDDATAIGKANREIIRGYSDSRRQRIDFKHKVLMPPSRRTGLCFHHKPSNGVQLVSGKTPVLC